MVLWIKKHLGEYMVILNMLGKIKPICISEKLKLYIANLPKEEHNNWNSYLIEEIEESLMHSSVTSERYEKNYGKSISRDIKEIIKKQYPTLPVASMTKEECIQQLVDDMICLYFDYEYEDMPVGDWTSNCFDGRLCEGDYVIKIAYFFHLICKPEIHNNFPQIPIKAPYCIYYSDDDNRDNRLIFNGTTDIDEYLSSLRCLGKLLDDFLVEEDDYYFLDYLFCELHDIDTKNFSANHCQKLYSLCEFFLEKESDHELDEKLPPFIKDSYSEEDRKYISVIARQIRNKVAHGDFSKFREKIEEYASNIMDKNGYWFDYTEYSRQNWAIMNLCFNLLDAIENLIVSMLINKQNILDIKNKRINKCKKQPMKKN